MSPRIILALVALLLALPTAAAIPEPGRSTIDSATYGCLGTTLAEAERREVQGLGVLAGQAPYPLPPDVDPRVTVAVAVADVAATVFLGPAVVSEAGCALTSIPRPVSPPDTSWIWREIVCPTVEC